MSRSSLEPFVCPGCHAINNEPHAGYCPDAAIERAREDAEDADDEADSERDYDDGSGSDWSDR